MRVAIIGAGVTGLVNARVLRPLGVDVVVYDSRPDVGGVWSATRGYPGQRLQNGKRSYELSELRMPAHYPAHPDRAQVRSYLAEYARQHGLEDCLRLSTTVVQARHDPSTGRWRISTDGPDGPREDRADWLIVANGTLSTALTPALEGADAFRAAGGGIVASADLGEGAALQRRHVVVLGYGKSATDIATAAASAGAASVTVIARGVPWKLPERLWGVPFERVLTSRVGEHLLWAPFRTARGRALRRADTLLRWGFQAALARHVRARVPAPQGRAPAGSIKNCSHLVTPGFHTAVEEGRIALRVGAQIAALGTGPAGPVVELADGTALPADLLVTATGYRTDLSFLDEATRSLLRDEHGRMPLHRHTVPGRVPRLLLAGWTNSFRSPIAAEIQAVWIAAFLHGALRPSRAGRTRPAPDSPTGLSILDQDAWLQEAGLPVPWRTVVGELLHPLDPAAYAGMHRRLQRRLLPLLEATTSEAAAPAPVAGDRTSSRTPA